MLDKSSFNSFDKYYFEKIYPIKEWNSKTSIPLVHAYINYLKIKRNQWTLDFGCAKGYEVKAFRELGYSAWGCDISNYAIDNTEEDIKSSIVLSTKEDPVPWPGTFDHIIAKNVFEYLTKKEVVYTLNTFANHALPITKVFLIISLNNSMHDWINLLEKSYWNVINAIDFVRGIDEHQTWQRNKLGFFTLQQKY